MRIERSLGEAGGFALLLLPALAVLVAAQLVPLGASLSLSFQDWSLARSPTPGPFVGFVNYQKAFSDPVFLGSTGFTILLASASTLLQISLGLVLALATTGEGYTLRLSRTLLMLPMVVAPIAVGTMWRMLLSARVGMVNKGLAAIGIEGPNWLGDPAWARLSLILVDAWEWLPFSTIVFTAALVGLPQDVLRAASVDGASRTQTFRLVVWPMLVPIVVIVAMFRLIDGLLTLDLVFTTTLGGPGYATHTLTYWIYQQGLRYFNISYAAALSWMMLLLCVAVAGAFLWWRSWLARWLSETRA
jgi:ABC-type sugar transport system permease subunit